MARGKADLSDPFLRCLAASCERLGIDAATPMLLAFSSGLDSTALLAGLLELFPVAPLRVTHVHHGLQAEADTWAGHCRQICQGWQVDCDILHVSCQALPGESQEACARDARYQALADQMRPGEWLLTAHHRQDQAETFLLQLLRGAGIEGLAGMAEKRPFAAGYLARPLLECDRASMQGFLEKRRIPWIEDPSNASAAFRRNRIRHQLIPFVQDLGWPEVARTTARSAANLADAKAVVEEVAAADWETCASIRGEIDRTRLRTLSPARQRYALRHGIRAQGLDLPGRETLETLRLRLIGDESGKTLEWQGGALWLRGGMARFITLDIAPVAEQVWCPAEGPPPIAGWQAALVAADAAPPAAVYHDLDAGFYEQQLRFSPRRGGEIYLTPQGHRRPLKKALQEARLAPAERRHLGLLFDAKGRLLAVPGLFVCQPGLPEAGSGVVLRLWEGRALPAGA
ncbi:tRNA lysidine(34) synthetase TilS [Thermithiobacillus plumbiphilus]|uniref:tRNA(Ile)-lysidine synthase n=1 Tax=Thermithiobacillus plumbiphilus TaxID=1729899 RepID=A0ABU9D3P1_9PROT